MSMQPDDGRIKDVTPYQMTLSGMVVPWAVHAVFNVAAGIGLALVGAPLIAAIWTVALCAADVVLTRCYRIWSQSAANLDSALGLRRLSGAVFLRTSLWFVAPLGHALAAPTASSFAFVAVTAISITALGVAVGWTSRRMFLAMVGPSLLAVAVAAVAHLGTQAALGVMVSLVSLAATLLLISIGTNKTVLEWSHANRRTLEILAEMKAALTRSEAAERRLRVAMDITDLYVYEVDYQTRELVSLGAEAAFFETPLTYTQFWKDPWFAVAPEDVPGTKAAWDRYEAGKEPYKAEYRIKRSDGSEAWAFAAAEITRDENGTPLSLVGAMHEITERKRSEINLTEALARAEAGSHAKSEFLAIMSHEIRTPLNGVLGMAQAMARDDLSAAQRERLDVIRKSGESLLILLNSVLDLSKIEAGKFKLDEGEVQIASLVQAALDAFGAEADDKGVALSLHIQPEAEGVYAGDSARLSQVIYNLVSNAVKFTPGGAVNVRVLRQDEWLIITVRDTGIGMSPDQLEAVFEKFVQADASVTRRFGGSGLGLTICRQLVCAMGGTIGAQSEAGQGSQFTVELPLPRLRDTPATVDVAGGPHESPQAEPAPLRLLVAEDNAVNQLVLRTLLQQVGIEPVIVANGALAVAAWRAEVWDLILMDIQMPEMDGLTATRTIRCEEPGRGSGRTPILALTANVMAQQIEAYLAAGMDRVVAKPIDVGRLIDAIQDCLEAPGELPAEHAA